MKNYIYIFIVLAFISCEEIEPAFFEREFLGSNGYDNYEYIEADVYSGVPDSKRVSYFNETFDNNSNGWEVLNSNQAYLNIENGAYIYQNKTTSASITSINKAIDQQRDFEIETSIKITESLNNNGNSFIWGYSNSDGYKFFCYAFSSNQKLWIGYYDYSTYVYWQDWLELNVNPINSYNKLTIRKINNKYYFYVNEQFIKNQIFVSFYDNKIGFKAEGNTTIVVDYLKIDYIND